MISRVAESENSNIPVLLPLLSLDKKYKPFIDRRYVTSCKWAFIRVSCLHKLLQIVS